MIFTESDESKRWGRRSAALTTDQDPAHVVTGIYRRVTKRWDARIIAAHILAGGEEITFGYPTPDNPRCFTVYSRVMVYFSDA